MQLALKPLPNYQIGQKDDLPYFRSRRPSLRENYRETEKAVLDAILGQGYDKRIRPSGINTTGRQM